MKVIKIRKPMVIQVSLSDNFTITEGLFVIVDSTGNLIKSQNGQYEIFRRKYAADKELAYLSIGRV